MLKKFVHGKNGEVLGTVVAIKTDENEFGVGWAISKRNASVRDIPNKSHGLKVAQGRAMSNRHSVDENLQMMPMNEIGDLVAHAYLEMVGRGSAYYKSCNLLQHCEQDSDVDMPLLSTF